MKTMLVIAVVGLVGSLMGKPLLAEVSGVDMPWYAQFGLCGLFGGILMLVLGKLIPDMLREQREEREKIADRHAVALDKLGSTVITGLHDVQEEIKLGNTAQLEELQRQRRGQV